MIYIVEGEFAPLNLRQFDYLVKHHSVHDGFYYLHLDKSSLFYDINKKLLKKRHYLKEYHDEVGEMLNLYNLDIVFNFDNMSCYHDLTKKMIMTNPSLIKILLKPMVSEHRYLHSLSVAETAALLASRYHIDTKKAYITGLLHDVCKNFNEEECDLYLRYYDQDKLKAPLPIKHGYVAAYFLKEKCNYCQKDVLRAIYHHSDGDYNSKLGMIIYIADKREPLRNLNDGLLELSLNNLYEGFRLLKEDVLNYLEKKNG